MLQIRTQTRQNTTRKLLMPNSGPQPMPATKAQVQAGFFKFTLNQKYEVVLQISQPSIFTYEQLVNVLISMKIVQKSESQGYTIQGDPISITNNQKQLIREREKLDLAKCMFQKESVIDYSAIPDAQKERKVTWRLKRTKLLKKETASPMKQEKDRINEQVSRTEENEEKGRYIVRPKSRNFGSLRKISRSKFVKNPEQKSDSFSESSQITQSAQIQRKKVEIPPAASPQIPSKSGSIFRIQQKKNTLIRQVVRRPVENPSPYLERLINAKLK